jgi:hypothetical protein
LNFSIVFLGATVDVAGVLGVDTTEGVAGVATEVAATVGVLGVDTTEGVAGVATVEVATVGVAEDVIALTEVLGITLEMILLG